MAMRKINNHRHNTVRIIGTDLSVSTMFWKEGYQVVSTPKDKADLIVFTGGEDINPALYGEKPIPETQYFNTKRDDREVEAYETYKKTPKVGICRGGQLLNILSGGSMFQHVDLHIGCNHFVTDLTEIMDKPDVYLNSCHHQMMIPGKDGELLAYAKKSTQQLGDPAKKRPKLEYDPEVIYYESTKSLCFQAHPEWTTDSHDCYKYFFKLIDYCL